MSRHPAEPGAAATDYLRLTALVALGWMWLRMALHALNSGEAMEPRRRRKLMIARFSMAHVLPRTVSLGTTLISGAAPIMKLQPDAS